MSKFKNIEEAKSFLKKNGYQTDNLWTVNDVQDKFKCTEEQAHDIIHKALTNEATMEQINFAINMEAENRGLEKHEEE